MLLNRAEQKALNTRTIKKSMKGEFYYMTHNTRQFVCVPVTNTQLLDVTFWKANHARNVCGTFRWLLIVLVDLKDKVNS